MADDVLLNKAANIERHLDDFLSYSSAMLMRDQGRAD